MFDQMKTLGTLAGLLKNKERMQELGEEFKEKVERIRVTGTAGGSAVRVTVSGKLRVLEVVLDPGAAAGLAEGDESRRMVEDLIREATNDALERAQALVAEEARRMAEELGLPDVPGLERMLT